MNIFIFSKALATKEDWRLISTHSLWTDVITQNFIALESLKEWIRKPNKRQSNIYVIWKVILRAFDFVGVGLVWKVGNGYRVRLGS